MESNLFQYDIIQIRVFVYLCIYKYGLNICFSFMQSINRGFKDIATAQQMLKRAQKMKSKKLRKKLGGL